MASFSTPFVTDTNDLGAPVARGPATKNLELRVNGQVFLGWKAAKVSRSIESLCGDFQLEATDRWSESGKPWVILEEQACEVWIAGELLISGYVDGRSFDYSENSHSISYEGRDKAGTLVDCSAVLDQWQFVNQSVVQFCKDLGAKYGIAVTLQPGIPESALAAAGTTGTPLVKATKLTIDPGDSAFEAMQKACRWCGLLPISDGNGGVMLCRAGASTCTTSLVEGVNIRRIHSKFDATQKFYTYRCLGQHSATDHFSGSKTAHVKGEAIDSTVLRKERILLIRPEHEVTEAQAIARAQWEAQIRSAKSSVVNVTVQGWTQKDGTVWPINALVNIDAPNAGVKGQLLIVQADYSLDESSGATTTLTLKTRDAYKPKPEIIKEAFYWVELKNGGK